MPPNMRLLSHNNESYHSVNMTETIREKFIQERQRSGSHWTNIIKDKAVECLRKRYSRITFSTSLVLNNSLAIWWRYCDVTQIFFFEFLNCGIFE